jgi:hypothetical protein
MSYSPNFRGNQSNASSRQLITDYVNGSGAAIPQGTPVTVNSIGQILPVDVTSESSVSGMVGYAYVRIPASASGPVISAGRLENIITGFSVGDPIYIGLSGTLINQKPDDGIAGFGPGDFVVFVGVLVQNEFNPAQTDLQLFTQVVGEL